MGKAKGMSLLAWIPLIEAAVSLAEGLFGAKKGKEKKDLVVGSVLAAANAAANVYQTNSGNTLPVVELAPVLGHLVDAAAGALFPNEVGVAEREAAP